MGGGGPKPLLAPPQRKLGGGQCPSFLQAADPMSVSDTNIRAYLRYVETSLMRLKMEQKVNFQILFIFKNCNEILILK